MKRLGCLFLLCLAGCAGALDLHLSNNAEWSVVTLPPPPPGAPALHHYQVDLDRSVSHEERPALRLRAVGAGDGEAALALRVLEYRGWRGRRIHLDGWLRTEQAGLSRLTLTTIHADNRRDAPVYSRGVAGTRDWTHVAVEMDVPPDMVAIFLGLQQVGPGTTWLDDAHVSPRAPAQAAPR